MKNLPLLIVCFLACYVPLACAQGDNSPESFLRHLYTRLADDAVPPEASAAEEQAAYARSLVSLMDRDRKMAQGVGMLDYMPVCSCQDAGGAVLQYLSLQALDHGKFRADVTLVFSDGEKRRLQLYLKKETAKWHIYDVQTQDIPSLRAALQKSIADRNRHAPDAFGAR